MNEERRFHIESDSLDTESIQRRIEEEARKRREDGVMGPRLRRYLSEGAPGIDQDEPFSSPLSELDFCASQAERTWEVSTAYPIATEKRILRSLILLFKRLGRLWARIAVGPMQRNQTIFNRYVTRALVSLREQAINEKSEERSREFDLCMIAESLSPADESEHLGRACAGKLSGTGKVYLVGPSPPRLACIIRESVEQLIEINTASSWDAAVRPAKSELPTPFLETLEDESAGALVIPEVCYWLRPERILGLCRKAYLKTESGGILLLPVRGFALREGTGGSWCSPELVSAVMERVGFTEVDIHTLEAPAGVESGTSGSPGYLATARKP